MPAGAQQAGPLAQPSADAGQKDATEGSAAPQSGVATPSPTLATSPATVTTPKAQIEVPAGTHIPLVLHNAISTRSARPGDPVYFESLFPIMIDGHVVIPAGSYISGEVTESKHPGRVKGKGRAGD